MTVTLTTFEEMTGIAAPGLSPAGGGRIYFDSGDLAYKVSQNGGAYANLVGGGGAGGWTDDGAIVRLTTISDIVGIGTATPAGGFKLHVVGNTRLEGVLNLTDSAGPPVSAGDVLRNGTALQYFDTAARTVGFIDKAQTVSAVQTFSVAPVFTGNPCATFNNPITWGDAGGDPGSFGMDRNGVELKYNNGTATGTFAFKDRTQTVSAVWTFNTAPVFTGNPCATFNNPITWGDAGGPPGAFGMDRNGSLLYYHDGTSVRQFILEGTNTVALTVNNNTAFGSVVTSHTFVVTANNPTFNTLDNAANAFTINESQTAVVYLKLITLDTIEAWEFGNVTINPSYRFLGTGVATFSGPVRTTSTATLAGFRAGGFGGDPSTLGDGDFWYNTILNVFRIRQNGVSQSLATSGAAAGWTDAGTQVELTTSSDTVAIGGTPGTASKLAVIGTSTTANTLTVIGITAQVNPLLVVQDATTAAIRFQVEPTGLASFDLTRMEISVADNTALAFDLQQGSNNYINIDTTDGAETLNLSAPIGSGVVALSGLSVTLAAGATGTAAVNLTAGANFNVNRSAGGTYIFVQTTVAAEQIIFGNVTENPDYNFLGTGVATFSGPVRTTTTATDAGFRYGVFAGAPAGLADGDVWYHLTHQAIAAFSSGVTQYVSGTLFSQNAQAIVTTTAAETTIFGAGVGTLTLPANFFTPGKIVRIRISGRLSSAGSETLDIKTKLGAITVGDTLATVLSIGALTNRNWELVYEMVCHTTGVAGNVGCGGYFRFLALAGSSGVLTNWEIGLTSTRVIDTTVANLVDVTVQWGSASASDTITSVISSVEVVL